MTEEEAKTKRCCGPSGCGFTSGAENHVAYHDGSTGELVTAVVPIRWCIGSACMAWRRNTATFLKDRKTGVFVREAKPGDTYSGLDLVAYEGWTDTGYCGLAGKP